MSMKSMKFLGVCLAFASVSTVLMSAMPDDGIMTKENGMYVVNTTSLATDVEGYEGATPLKIYIKRNKIEKIEALRNNETPKYWAMIKKRLLDKWNGMTVKQAATVEVDGVTGATFSSKAVKENVRRGVNYYNNNK